MSPYQHGEVYVTKDGAETDLDLGNYERFIDAEVTAESNVTSGQIYSTIITKERRGDFLGGTIQIVPHLTNEIKGRFNILAEKSQAEVILIEVGGTVGDIEGQPFLEAIRQMIPLPTMETIYEIPLILEETGLGQLIVDKLGIKTGPADLRQWQGLVERIKTPHEPVRIALVGKYVELNDAYYSVREALYHAALYHDRTLDLYWVQSDDLDEDNIDRELRSAQGIIIPGGFGVRGIQGMIKAATYARENEIPYFGLCLGLQVMTIELARHVYNSGKPNSTEFDPDTKYPVIDYMMTQKKITQKGATMRLGNYPCKLLDGSLAGKAYGLPLVQERHRHRLEFNNEYREPLHKAGLVYSGVSPDETLVEVCELAEHPWMLSCQFHPEFLSRPGRPHPLFRDFIGVSKDVLREGAQPPLPLAAN
jgi:CTP synthase